MLELVGEAAWVLAPLLGMTTLAWSLWEYRRTPLIPRFVASALFAGATFWLSFVVAIGITLRDGLGPDAVTSTGEVALARAFEGMWIALGGALLPVLMGAWLLRRARARSLTASDSRDAGER